MSDGTGKWCGHCQKCDHDDAECWSTRWMGAPPEVMVITGGGGLGFTELSRLVESLKINVIELRPVSLTHPKEPIPFGDIARHKLAKEEGKRARKAQIRRNGGKR
jgi:hypothetical protein